MDEFEALLRAVDTSVGYGIIGVALLSVIKLWSRANTDTNAQRKETVDSALAEYQKVARLALDALSEERRHHTDAIVAATTREAQLRAEISHLAEMVAALPGEGPAPPDN